jgi:hypothetical protein
MNCSGLAAALWKLDAVISPGQSTTQACWAMPLGSAATSCLHALALGDTGLILLRRDSSVHRVA